MFNLDKRNYLIIGAIVEGLSLLLLILGFVLVLGNQINATNVITYIVFSTIAGGLAAAFVYFRLKAMFFLFILGLAIGFFEMYRSFYNVMTGWGDLAGVISLMMWPAFGLGAGLIVQLLFYLYKKFKK